MTALAAQTMAARLTLPFARGADTATLTLTGSTATGASVAAYDFREHNALFGLAPEPRYVLLAMTDAPVRTSVTVDYVVPGPAGTVVPRTTQPLEIPEVRRRERHFFSIWPLTRGLALFCELFTLPPQPPPGQSPMPGRSQLYWATSPSCSGSSVPSAI
jgi:hypothetical protein